MPRRDRPDSRLAIALDLLLDAGKGAFEAAKVFDHERLCRAAVAGVGGVNEPPVVVHGAPGNAPVRRIVVVQALQELEKSLHHEREDPVAGCVGEQRMELDVVGERAAAFGDRSLSSADIRFQVAGERNAGPLHRLARDGRFEQDTRFVQLIHVELAVLQRGLERSQHWRDSGAGHEDAAPVPVAHVDQALDLEHTQRFPNAGAADAELFGQHLLGRKAVARPPAAAEDLVAELLDDGVEGARARP